jgi:hypothetical protein
MKKRTMIVASRVLVLAVGLWILTALHAGYAQDIRWLHITELQSPINEIGAEYENEFPQGNTNYFSWPALYSVDQNTARMKGLWIGCKNFEDLLETPGTVKVKSVKVIGSGPRNATDRVNEIFEKEIKLIARTPHPIVIVDDQRATVNDTYDLPDSLDDNLEADRIVLVKFNTSIGVSVTKKVMVFASSEHSDYFIHDYVFKNTGIYDREGDVHQQTLHDVWFYFLYRYAFAGVSSSGFGSSWGAFGSTWGESTLNHAFGGGPEFNDPTSPFYQMRGFYSWYGPDRTSNQSQLTFAEDWGCPNFTGGEDVLGSAKYAGCVTLHADTDPYNKSDDASQPKTTWFIGSDINIMLANVSQYDEVYMADRYAAMSEGHPDRQHDEVVGEDYALNYTDPRRQTGGGTSQGQGFGPYTLAPGDSIHIVFAEGVSGISWEKGREVGGNWLQWKNGTGQPTLIMPDGSIASAQNPYDYTAHDAYKRAWVETGRDTILKTYRAAIRNYDSDYRIPKPPPPPSQFIVTSGGDRIRLEWADNAEADPHFDGYVIYRSEGNVLDYRTVYDPIFECNKSNVVHSFDDLTAKRGFDYYYYIQSKDDGTQNDIDPGTPLYSSPFWTLTSVAATLQRPAITTTLDSVRVVPNPYDIRARLFQFGSKFQYDRIAFYGLPPVCKLKIFTEIGELIWEKEHTKGTGDELWDSTTSSGQIIASGIYILYVEAPDGRSVFRKFVVIR